MNVDRGQARFDGVIVRKPWGHEYLVYQNAVVALWCLHLRSGARTSLHCHPRKKTGLIVLDGEVEIGFLNDSTRLAAVAKMMIRPGLFHSTTAVGPGGATVMEVETPCDKTNLVRLEDAYDRAQQPYEGAESMEPLTASCLQFEPPEPGRPRRYTFAGRDLRLEVVDNAMALCGRDPGDVFVILDGTLESRDGEPVLAPGDVVTPATLDRLATAFQTVSGLSIVVIHQAASSDAR